jgi:hypothetical protein
VTWATPSARLGAGRMFPRHVYQPVPSPRLRQRDAEVVQPIPLPNRLLKKGLAQTSIGLILRWVIRMGRHCGETSLLAARRFPSRYPGEAAGLIVVGRNAGESQHPLPVAARQELLEVLNAEPGEGDGGVVDTEVREALAFGHLWRFQRSCLGRPRATWPHD